MSDHVLVIGAGIIGATTALAFAERGYRVTVIDRADTVAAGASGANGAQLSYSYSDAMASPVMLRQLKKIFLGRDPTTLLSTDFDRDLIGWGLRFLRNCTQSRSDRNTLAVLKLALESRGIIHDWQRRYRLTFDHRPAGKLHLYNNPAGLYAAATRVELKNRACFPFGIHQKLLSRDEAIAIEPALEHVAGELAGAVYSPIDEVGDAASFSVAALEQVKRLGGDIQLGISVDGFVRYRETCPAVKTSAGEIKADTIVICAGYNTVRLAAMLNASLPILPVAGYSLTCPATAETPSTSITDMDRKFVLCRIGDKTRIAGLADLGRVAGQPTPERIDALLKTTRERFPLAADYDNEIHPWMGTRPMTPDSQPIVRACGAHNVYVNCGHGMLGWTLAAATAGRLRQLVEQDQGVEMMMLSA